MKKILYILAIITITACEQNLQKHPRLIEIVTTTGDTAVFYGADHPVFYIKNK